MKSRILVVDDEESIRFTFKEFLTEDGYEVVCSGNYREAVQTISEMELDLVFADIILGEHTGIDILSHIKNLELLCPVIMITGQPDVSTAADSLRLGAFDYLPKPINQDKLLRITKIALEHKKVVADRARYRKNLDAIFRSVMDAIITVDSKMRVIECNAAVNNIFGIPPGEIIGKQIHHALGPDMDLCRTILEETLYKQKVIKEFSLEYRRPQKPRQILIANSSPLISQNKNTIGAVLVVRDVTRLTDMESELKERHDFHNIVGKSRKMQDIYSLIENLLDIQTTVLISGESGTGKELIARAIHYSGPRSFKPLVTVNCSTLVENILESELFGHVKGAFTGAVSNKTGRFQEADQGSIFLDEIGDISPVIQLKLLRVLQEKEFERVGDSTPIKVDVRVIAATNRKLSEEVKNGKFREDLYYRLKVVEIELPPLRERLEDIPLLVDHFCRIYKKQFNKNIAGVSDEVLALFMRYPWPGNIRELEHIIERAFIFCREKNITVNHLPLEMVKQPKGIQPRQADPVMEAENIIRALKKTGWNKAKSSRILGISRKTLYAKIKKYRIEEMDEV